MTSWVYAVRPDNELQVKIGMSKIPELRRRALEKITGKQLKLIRVWGPFKNGRRFERAAHIHFAAWAIGKEWFCLDNYRLIELDAVFTNLKDEAKYTNRFRIAKSMRPLIEAYRKAQRMDTLTAALNSMVILAAETIRKQKPHTTQA